MAQMALPYGDSQTEESILTLDKSNDPWQAQIAKACKILNIDLDPKCAAALKGTIVHDLRQCVTGDPRPEWTLRWLLKKLQPVGRTPSSPCQDFRSWVLLQELVVRTHTANIARLLSAQGFTNILRTTIQWLQETVRTTLAELSLQSEGSGDSRSDISEEAAKDPPTSQKRKRDDRALNNLSDIVSAPDTLYLTICNAVEQIKALTKDDDKHSRGFAVEYIKAALKSSPAEAASILGGSLYMINRLLQVINGENGQKRYSTSGSGCRLACEYCVELGLDLWKIRSTSTQSASVSSSNEAFMAHCLLPSLQLLHTYRECSSPKKHVGKVEAILEKLLLEHVIMPSRASFLSSDPSRDHDTSEPPKPLSDEILAAMEDLSLVRATHDSLKAQRRLMMKVISLLFEVAIRSSLRESPKLRQIEDPWLQELFDQLSICAYRFLRPKTPNPSSSLGPPKYYNRFLEMMLQIAVDHKVRLSIPAIETIIEEASGLFHKESINHIGWSLVNLCLLNDADVFVVPPAVNAGVQTYSYRQPNKYLVSLLTNLTIKGSSQTKDRDLVLTKIIISLFEAFADARDLTGFIEHWREQLKCVERKRALRCEDENNLDEVPSIWEDDNLSQSIANRVQSALTSDQIQSILATVRTDSASLAEVVIMDCLYTGCTEQIHGKLSDTTLSIFGILKRFVADNEGCPQALKWRVWRAMTSINECWPLLAGTIPFKRDAHKALLTAFEINKTLISFETKRNRPDYTEHLFSFRFIISFASLQDFYWAGLGDFSSRKMFNSAAANILNIRERFCQQVQDDRPGLLRPLAIPVWDGLSSGVKSIDILYIGCLMQICLSSKALSCLNIDLKHRLFNQIFWCAVNRRLSSQPNSPQDIDYSSLWECCLNNKALTEDAASANCFWSLQATQFLSLLDAPESDTLRTNSEAYLLAFESLQKAPTNHLKRGHRTEIANSVLWVLLSDQMMSLEKKTAHLELLLKAIAIPNSSMNLFQVQDDLLKFETIDGQSLASPNLAVLLRALKLEKCSENQIECIALLRHLTEAVMSYLLSTLPQERSVKHLQSINAWLNASSPEKFLNDCEYEATPWITIFGTVVDFYTRHSAQVAESLDTDFNQIASLRPKFVDFLVEVPRASLNFITPESRQYTGVTFEFLALNSDLLVMHPKLPNISARLAQLPKQSQLLDSEFDHILCDLDYLKAKLTHFELALGGYDQSLHPAFGEAATLLRHMKNAQERKTLLSHFQDAVSALDSQRKGELLGILSSSIEIHSPDFNSLLVLQRVLCSLKDQDVEEARATSTRIFSILCSLISDADGFRVCILSMQCLSLLLQRQPRIISQYHIDSLLSAIAIRSSKISSFLEEKHSPMLYTGLCRLFSSILTMHRTKTGGRYHLIIPALQGLLQCLFVPYTGPSSSTESRSAFGEHHAAAYSRILTSICDPSVSAVTQSRKQSRATLNDQTKKARSIAGQHLPYLIMSYCDFQLKGRLVPGMRAALDPGLYSILSVMSPEVMRTMNAGMKDGQRAVWKSLYGEWQRLGR